MGPRVLGTGQFDEEYYIPTSGTPVPGCDQVVFDGSGYFAAQMTAERKLVGYWLTAEGAVSGRVEIADLGETTGNLSQPSVCVLKGAIYVGWVVIAEEADNEKGGAQYICRVSADGAVSAPVCLCAERVWPRRPAMAAGENGLLLVYRRYDVVDVYDDWEYKIHNCYACYVREDLTFRQPYRINVEDFAIYPGVAWAQETGRFLVVWEHGSAMSALVTADTTETPENTALFDLEYTSFEKPWVASDGRSFLVSAAVLYGNSYGSESTQGIWTVPVDEGGRPGEAVRSVPMEGADSVNNGQLEWDGRNWLLAWSCEREGLNGYASERPDFRLTDSYLVRLDANSLSPADYPIGLGTGSWHQFSPRFAVGEGGKLLAAWLESGGDATHIRYMALQDGAAGRTVTVPADSDYVLRREMGLDQSRYLCGDGDGATACVIGWCLATYRDGEWITSEGAGAEDKTFGCSVRGNAMGLSGWSGLARRLVRGEEPWEDYFEDLIGYGAYGNGIGGGIWTQDANTYWIAAAGGSIWRCRVGEERMEKQFDAEISGADFHDIHGSGPEDIYAVGDKGLLVHYDGSGWTRIETPLCLALNAVRADGAGGAFVVGDGGAVLRVTEDGSCLLLESPTCRALYDVWCLSPERCFACGADSAVYVWENGVWSRIAMSRSYAELWGEEWSGEDEELTGPVTDLFGVVEEDTLRLFALSSEEELGLYSIALPALPEEIEAAARAQEPEPDPGFAINITDYTGGAAAVHFESEAPYKGEVRFRVDCPTACVAALVTENGYAELSCVIEDDAPVFTVNVAADTALVIALRGDTNLDGSIGTKDATFIRKIVAQVAGIETQLPDLALSRLAGDANADGSIGTKDATAVRKFVAQVAGFTLPWKR